VENSTKFLALPLVRSKSSSSHQDHRFAVLFSFLALFEGTQKDIPSAKVYYCHKVFQTSTMEKEINKKRKGNYTKGQFFTL
jgi:hypothetical protein